MAIQDLVPWRNRGREVSASPAATHPALKLHRQVNRLFDDMLHALDFGPWGADSLMDGQVSWPTIELSETDNEIKVSAELPGLDTNDVDVEYANGALVIRGEKRTETEDKQRLFSERYYGRFERRIPIPDVDHDKASATFSNGVLTVTLPKSPEARQKVKRIAINGTKTN